VKSSSTIRLAENNPNLAAGVLARFSQIALVFAFQAAILFLAAGTLDWAWAWIFLGICVASVAINSIFLLRTSVETIAERGRPGETKAWDKVVGGLWSLFIFLLVPLVAGLDVRLNWTRANAWWNVAGAVTLAAGLGLGGWAMIANAFFSTAVRIQTERGHTVCRTGPYRFVRHPGYLGFMLQSLGTPILLASFWALIPGIVAAALMMVRAALEDQVLHKELDGYREYAAHVRYRLVPGVW
jgi:protein-S-isoprenylcysteine O-methyltransferase Ste14